MAGSDHVTHQPPPQGAQPPAHPPQQEAELVGDDVDLLLGLQAVLLRHLQEQLGGDLLEGGDLLLLAPQLLLHHLQGATQSRGG